MKFEIRIAAAAFAALMVTCAPASAKTWLKTGGASKTPFGHYEYCKRGGSHCGSQRAVAPAQMTESRWAKIRRINTAVNKQIKPVLDINSRGVNEYWEVPKSQGDCEDYALLKRSRMMAAGFKASQLPLTKVRLPNGQAHIVLIVRTNQGDYMLDNLSNRVQPVSKVRYRFLSMQASNNANNWLTINGKTKTAALQ
ncbi:transglutaminase-like cysteine peptidase [Ahrensia sp. 13_GOM-1096m]|uniref:transglutaminase-like cysteine peptidase n=1 Tax=Ahrensia sp. 13_GOM-1096m TaxID=1380380 RepID=UPI00192E63E6|nr:transglutaminase-like cysteine peptidase [Ahrensia sp. 13_GOM-1096m]